MGMGMGTEQAAFQQPALVRLGLGRPLGVGSGAAGQVIVRQRRTRYVDEFVTDLKLTRSALLPALARVDHRGRNERGLREHASKRALGRASEERHLTADKGTSRHQKEPSHARRHCHLFARPERCLTLKQKSAEKSAPGSTSRD
jgi:hypothetical protein